MREKFTAAKKKMVQLVRHKMVLVMLGGAVGTLLRYVISKWFDEQSWTRGFPYGTMFINVTGSFILGLAAVMFRDSRDWLLLLGTGFCGGYTTFSTFELETYRLVQDHSYLRACYNVGGSVAAGFVGVVLGIVVGYLLFPKHAG